MSRPSGAFPGAPAIASLLLALGVSILAAPGQARTSLDPDIPAGHNSERAPALVSRVAFGSCSKLDLPQPLWEPIRAERPDLWIWMGDIVYADQPGVAGISGLDGLRRMYAAQKDLDGYRRLRESVRVLGIWDDHDYGRDDGGKDFALKDGSRQLLLDFLDEPKQSPRRTRDGAYGSYAFGSPDRRLEVILLDCRWSKGSREKGGELLGPEQWVWLGERLQASRARVLLVVSSITVLSDSAGEDGWSDQPRARERLLRMLARAPAERLVLLTGDRHFAQVLERRVPGRAEPLVEIVSSGMTHNEDENEVGADPYRVRGPFTDRNYGVLAVDWDSSPPGVAAEIKDREGKARLRWEAPPAGPREARPRGRESGGPGGSG